MSTSSADRTRVPRGTRAGRAALPPSSRTAVLHIILCWHFHQPDYRNDNDEYRLPWTYLHALKDYSDMAAHLEAVPNVCAVVNFVPSLVDQLDDYARQCATGQLRDPLLARLIDPELQALDAPARQALLQACFRLNLATMLEPFPAYKRLHDMYRLVEEGGADYLSGQYLADLVTWYHLAWTGETVRRAYPLVTRLMEKGRGYTLEERRALFELVGEVVGGIIPRYRALMERGQIELSTTPHSHPMAPLMIDFRAAQEARPMLALPINGDYPGGAERVRAHIEAARQSHEAHFGVRPEGFWPAEGGVSEPVVRLFSEAGIAWAASGEGVLRHSLATAGADLGDKTVWAYRPYRLKGASTACFFRDDQLSDLIGFEYKGWWAGDAVRHFMQALDEIRRHSRGRRVVVPVILDGENAWEYYPFNGYYFLSELYQALAEHPLIHTTTFSDYLALFPETVAELPRLTAGSWVYGDFTTWIGDPAKNRAWDLLCEAKRAYDRAMAGGRLSEAAREEAEALLKSCESSDWFWWFGDYNPRESVETFDELYRAKLRRLYALLHRRAPEGLSLPLCRGGEAAEAGGVMRRGQPGA